MLIAVVAIAVAVSTGVAHSFSQPIYGPIDEASHTAYAFHVGKYGVPPVLGRDRAFIGRTGVALGSRDVDMPRPEKASAPVPIGVHGVFGQPEAIQPPLYYYVMAPLSWISSGDAAVIAMRLAGVLMVVISVVVAFVAVVELSGDALAAGFAAMVLATMSGITDFLSQVQNDALLLPLAGGLFLLLSRGIRTRVLTWPLALCAAGLSITQVVAVPMAALAVLGVGALHISRAKTQALSVALKTVAAGVPLAGWIVSNEIRYGSLLPHDVTAASNGLFKQNNDQFLHIHEIAYPVLNSVIGGAYTVLQPSPYVADFRPLSLLIPLILVGTGCVCAFRSERCRQALGYSYFIASATLVTIFLAVAASLIGTGGDLAAMYIHRYYMPTYFAAACVAGIAAGGLSSRPWFRRTFFVAIPLLQVYWSINASTLT